MASVQHEIENGIDYLENHWMDALNTCRPNDGESRNLLTTQNSGIVVEETVGEINERKNRETNVLIFNAPEPKIKLKEERVRTYMEFVEGLCNEVCNLNLEVKVEINKVIRLGKKTNRRRYR